MTKTTLAKWWPIAILAAPMCCLGGCSEGRPSGSVSGTVTLGGAPLTAGTVLFSNSATGVGISADLDSSGAYHIPSLPADDYQVAVSPPPPPAPHEMDQPRPAPPAIPPRYGDPATSGLNAAVEPGANTLDFTLSK